MGRGPRSEEAKTTARGLLYGSRLRGAGPRATKPNLPTKPRCWADEDKQMFAYLEKAGYIEPGNYSFAQGLYCSFGKGTASFEISDRGDDLTIPVTTLTLRDSDGRLGITVRHRDERSQGYLECTPIDRGELWVNNADEMIDDLVANGKEAGLDYVEAHMTYERIKPHLERGERVEIVWHEDDEADNSSEKILREAIGRAHGYRLSYDDETIDTLVDDLEAADPADTSSYIDVLNRHDIGRQIMNSWGSTWVYRILIDRKDQD